MTSSAPSPRRAAVALQIVLAGHLVLTALGLLANRTDRALLLAVRDGSGPADADWLEAATRHEQMAMPLGVAGVVWFFLGALVFWRWSWCAHARLRALGVEGKAFTPASSVWWWFIPVANLWVPGEAMSELWRASHFPRDWARRRATALVWIWWTLFIGSRVITRVAGRVGLRSEDLDFVLGANTAGFYAGWMLMAAAVTLIVLVRSVTAAQLRIDAATA